VPLSTIHNRGIMFYGCLFGRPLSICALLMLILRDMVSLYLMDGYQWNLPQIFVMWFSGARFSKNLMTNLWKSLTYEKFRMSMWLSKNFTKILWKT